MANRYATFLEAVIEASVPAAAFTPAATSSPTLEIGRASTTNQAGILQPIWQESQNLDFVNVTGDWMMDFTLWDGVLGLDPFVLN